MSRRSAGAASSTRTRGRERSTVRVVPSISILETPSSWLPGPMPLTNTALPSGAQTSPEMKVQPCDTTCLVCPERTATTQLSPSRSDEASRSPSGDTRTWPARSANRFPNGASRRPRNDGSKRVVGPPVGRMHVLGEHSRRPTKQRRARECPVAAALASDVDAGQREGELTAARHGQQARRRQIQRRGIPDSVWSC